jgi:hypothetical protein
MPTATIQTIRCVRSASGIDSGVFESFARLPLTVLPSELDAAIAAVKALPGVLAAIDAARADPDNLYITAQTTADRDLALWPAPGRDVSMLPDQSVAPSVSLDFDHSQNLSLFDHDIVSADDHLGSIMMSADEQGKGEVARLASSSVEGSVYYVIYRVD